MTDQFDVVIRGGTLVDGTGAPRRRGDLGIRGGRIAALGDVRGSATRTVDADGCVIAPGFVDIHTHYDAQVFWDRMLTISPWHGVTSVVVGNCGFGVAPTRPAHRELVLRTLENVEGMSLDALQAGLGAEWPFETFPQFLDAIERRGTAINVGALIGHTPLRLYVMGEEATERAATSDEIAAMRRIVDDALAAGALGFATSKSPTHVGFAGRPVPSRAASIDEITTLAGALSKVGRGVLQATIGPELLLHELADVHRATGRTVTWTALLSDIGGPGGHRPFLAQTEQQHRDGIAVVPQVACRPLRFEFQWKAPFPFESMSIFKPVSAAEGREAKARIYADPAFRAAFRDRSAHPRLAPLWTTMEISMCPSEPPLEGRLATEVAAERGRHVVDLVLDLALASELEARFRIAVMNTDEEAVGELLRHPATVLGLSDAGAHASQLCDACFSTHLLGHWTRAKGVLTIEEAVRMLTLRPAEVFGIAGRGRLAEGLAADVTVFDPATVGCSPLRRVRDLPAGADRLVADATGIRAVLVNGIIIREDGRDRVDPDGDLPGRVLRGGDGS
jgi:N-acyl-D-aspartate/D-glutamate deacylase